MKILSGSKNEGCPDLLQGRQGTVGGSNPPSDQSPHQIMWIRQSKPSDAQVLLDIWLRSVRKTHTFLAEGDIQTLLPAVRDYISLSDCELWSLRHCQTPLIGFMALSGQSVEALFMAPEYFRWGGGRMLLAHARHLKGPLHVEVNEQNPGAVRFYAANGFSIVGRSPLDREGRPYPLLLMAEMGSAMHSTNPRGGMDWQGT